MDTDAKLIVFLSPLALIALYFLGRPILKRIRRKRLFSAPFSGKWREILQNRMPLFHRLPPGIQRQLEGHIHVFLDEKNFVGCGGLEISDEIRVTVAGMACLLLLNRKGGCFDQLSLICIYPSDYYVETKTVSEDGVVHEGTEGRSGESWDRGVVVLSWDDTLRGATHSEDGENVVIHEFAHQLDQESGSANGAPILECRKSYSAWASVLGAGYKKLQRDVERGRASLLDQYGASHPSEFFAVATETFFENPKSMKRKQPELYKQLARFYQVNPAQWAQAHSEGQQEDQPTQPTDQSDGW